MASRQQAAIAVKQGVRAGNLPIYAGRDTTLAVAGARSASESLWRPFWFPVAAICALGVVGCNTPLQGRQPVDRVNLSGTQAVSASDGEDRLATAPSPRFLGIWNGVVFDYAYFDKHVLQLDIERLERFYRSKGYYTARVRAARVIQAENGHVSVEITIDEGPVVTVRSLIMTGLETVPFAVQAKVINASLLEPGDIFDEDKYERTKQKIVETLGKYGYAWAEAKGKAEVDVISGQATVSIAVDAGQIFRIRNVIIQGLGEVPEGPVRRTLSIRKGDIFSSAELESAKLAVLDLGVFSDVQVSWPKRGEPAAAAPVENGSPVVDILVTVTPSKLHALRLGGGLELDVVRTDLHATVSWEDRNFLGGLRRLALNVKPGIVLFPTTIQSFVVPDRVLPEVRSKLEFRQPSIFEARTALTVRGDFDIFPVLMQPVSRDVILGYRDALATLGLDRHFLSNLFYVAASFNAQWYFPFTYLGPLADGLDPVALRFVELETDLILRDSASKPHKGIFIGNNLQFAGGIFGGDIADIKVQPDVRAYVPISRTVTFAVRGSVGFLFPRNYGSTLDTAVPSTRDLQELYFRALFSGGPNSNRGYPFRGVGPHGIATFFSPQSLPPDQAAAICAAPNPPDSVCQAPLGGLSLWEASAEVRFPLLGALTAAVFLDASDVARERLTLRFNYPHMSAGGGLRYDTPVGPVRLDVGYRIPGLQKIGGQLDPAMDGNPGTIFGAPIAISIAIGEAF